MGRNFDRTRRRQADRYHFDALDIAHARERASTRAIAAAWAVAGVVVAGLAAATLFVPAISPLTREAVLHLQFVD